MPKIIENLREKLLAEARRQIEESGYASTTIRSIAKACGVGTGTVYNYFSSKDMLIASFVAEDWTRCLEEMRAQRCSVPKELFQSIFASLERFIKEHASLFYDKDAAASYSASFMIYHAQLRSQIAELIRPLCKGSGKDGAFFSEFAAEALLTWTSSGKSFEEQWSVLKELFRQDSNI